jgi:hypothetical protein
MCSELDGILVSVLSHILSHHLRMISSEDAFFSYISSRLLSDPEYLNLLQFVRFEYLSAEGNSECISEFVSSPPDSIYHRLWESISRGLISRLDNELAFPLKEAKSSVGILSYLTWKHAGNVHDKGIVTITSKSVDNDAPKDFSFLADLTSDRTFGSEDKTGQWICWDFHELRVRPTHSTIQCDKLRS